MAKKITVDLLANRSALRITDIMPVGLIKDEGMTLRLTSVQDFLPRDNVEIRLLESKDPLALIMALD